MPTTLTPEQVAQLPPDHRRALERRGVFRMADPADVPDEENVEAEAETDEVVLDFEALYRTLSVKEAGELERMAGVPFLDFHQHIRGVAALIYYIRRQADKHYTYQQALDLPVAEIVQTINRSAIAKVQKRLAADPLGTGETSDSSTK